MAQMEERPQVTAGERKLRAYGKKLGLSFRIGKAQSPITYDGHGTVRLYRQSDILEAMSHEIGHWCVALPKGRGMIEWGLGESPFSFNSWDFTGYVEPRIFIHENQEPSASLLGIHLLSHVSTMDHWLQVFRDHSWDLDDSYEHRSDPTFLRGRKVFHDACGVDLLHPNLNIPGCP